MINDIVDRLKCLTFPSIIGIDGRCASGKTTLAALLKRNFDCNVIHMDDFFLRPQQRTDERLKTPGGNIDYERFYEEVLIPLKKHISFSYRPYLCKSQSFGEEIMITPKNITIIEGSYACHPKFLDFLDFKIFMNVEQDEQLKRIKNRNGDTKQFVEKWIPLEEEYFEFYKISEKCDIIL